VAKIFKQFKIRVKVHDSKEEMSEFLKHCNILREKRKLGVLVVKDDDVTLTPSFMTEYPKIDTEGTYFVVRSWTEII
jgi:transposase